MAFRGFADMTPEQLAAWVRDVRPILVREQERAHERAREQSLKMLGRPIRRPAPADQEENADG